MRTLSFETILKAWVVVTLGAVVWCVWFSPPERDEAPRSPFLGNGVASVEWDLPDPDEVVEGDLASDLILRVIDRDFDSRFDVAVGRFFETFDIGAAVLDDLDIEELRPVRRGADWVRAESVRRVAKGENEKIWIRFVGDADGWKVECVRCMP